MHCSLNRTLSPSDAATASACANIRCPFLRTRRDVVSGNLPQQEHHIGYRRAANLCRSGSCWRHFSGSASAWRIQVNCQPPPGAPGRRAERATSFKKHSWRHAHGSWRNLSGNMLPRPALKLILAKKRSRPKASCVGACAFPHRWLSAPVTLHRYWQNWLSVIHCCKSMPDIAINSSI